MTREEAIKRIAEIPEFVPGACSDCGAVTMEEAGKKCRPYQMPCGDYVCATPDEPQPEETGPLMQRNPEYDHYDGYLWGWYAVDEGYTKTPPTWHPFEANR